MRWTVWVEGPSEATADEPISSRLFVAASEADVHGAVWLREHEFWIDGQPIRAGWAKYPVVESLIDPAYNGVPGALVFRLLREQPRLMALGLGGHGGAFAQLLRGMRWTGTTIPFFVMPVRPARVLRRLNHLRRTGLRRLVLDALAFSGVGWAGWTALRAIRGVVRPAPGGYRVEVVNQFEAWADALWEQHRGKYAFIARRDAAMLNAVYPPTLPVVRLRVFRGGATVGWACVLRRDLTASGDTAFGALRVGLIADGLADPADAFGVTDAAAAYLRTTDVDILFSNQSHDAWCRALRDVGFVSAPSQFAFYRSPQMETALGAHEGGHGLLVNRGDCDGPMFA